MVIFYLCGSRVSCAFGVCIMCYVLWNTSSLDNKIVGHLAALNIVFDVCNFQWYYFVPVNFIFYLCVSCVSRVSCAFGVCIMCFMCIWAKCVK